MTKDFPGIWKWILPALIALLSMPTACQASLKMKDAKVESRGACRVFRRPRFPEVMRCFRTLFVASRRIRETLATSRLQPAEPTS